MAKTKTSRVVSHKAALRLISELSGIPDEEYASEFRMRAFSLADGRYISEILPDDRWRIWDSVAAYREIRTGSSTTGSSFDPVKLAVGGVSAFIEESPSLAKELIAKAKGRGAIPSSLAQAVASVDRLIARHPGHYWAEDSARLRSLIAFVGEVVRELRGGKWAEDQDDIVVIRLPNGTQVSPGRMIVAQANEAPRGGFSVVQVLEELGSWP